MSSPSANTPHLAARPSAGFEVRAPSNAAAIAASVPTTCMLGSTFVFVSAA